MLTDFGESDPYVGIVKGVMLREDRGLKILDLCHQVPPGELEVAGFWLAQSLTWLPQRSVVLCVVDPGVGGSRAPIVADTPQHTFVAPDNGVLSEVLERSGQAAVYRIVPDALGLQVTSRTFHARDLFGPVAAALATGRVEPAALGPKHQPVNKVRAAPIRDHRGLRGRVLFVDHFGNLVTDIPSQLLDRDIDRVSIGEQTLRIVETYGEAQPGECVGVPSSFGTLEVAQRDGSAARTLGVSRTASLWVERRC